MSGSMFIAVRTNDGTLMYADGHSRSSYDVFSYVELLDGDDTKAIEFITAWNKDEEFVPTHVRPLEYGAIVVDFPTRQIFNDSYYDTNIDLVSYLGNSGPFIDQMKALGRTRTASDEELIRPVFDLEGNLWNGVGEKPEEGGDDNYRNMSYREAFFIDYSPWKVRCFLETPGGRIAFMNAVEACGFPVRRDLWKKDSCETEGREILRARANADLKSLVPRLVKEGVCGEPLWSIDDTSGAFTAHVILKFALKGEAVEHVLVPITLSGTSEIKPHSRIVGSWHPDETKYVGRDGVYSDRDGRGDWQMLPYSKGVAVENRLALFACLLLGAGGKENDVLWPLQHWYDNDEYAEAIPFSRMSEIDIDNNLLTPDEAETDRAEIERTRAEAERRLRNRWAVYEGKLMRGGVEAFWGVSCDNKGKIEIGPSVYGGNGSGTIHGFFGVERRAEAFAYARRLLELGCGTTLEVSGDNEIITPGLSRSLMNHGDEIHEMAKELAQTALHSMQSRDGRIDPDLKPQFRAVAELARKHRAPQWENLEREWPLDAEWKAIWEPLSAALGEVTPEKLDGLGAGQHKWDDPRRFWRIKAALDLVTFPERLRQLASES